MMTLYDPSLGFSTGSFQVQNPIPSRSDIYSVLAHVKSIESHTVLMWHGSSEECWFWSRFHCPIMVQNYMVRSRKASSCFSMGSQVLREPRQLPRLAHETKLLFT
ncbi:hypothetical protein AVEN_85539-1 [Araneus ventricosus]|uniref:Uncharacterized protein n=1 Tax=Araneus ventricosus TaxID=182803 RepID=A0A4Y2REN9_ARAVE|nr:hypothetical protein AVEN_85539-1 [Araneus ventricosus]